MKLTFAYLLSLLFLINACSSSKNMEKRILQTHTWQLEYLSGPKISFNGLFPDKKPEISFIKSTQMVQGNSGCNGYTAPYTLKGHQISFGEPGPSTLMYCGEGETFFRNTIRKAEKYQIDGEGKLILLQNDVALMRFKKTTS